MPDLQSKLLNYAQKAGGDEHSSLLSVTEKTKRFTTLFARWWAGPGEVSAKGGPE